MILLNTYILYKFIRYTSYPYSPLTIPLLSESESEYELTSRSLLSLDIFSNILLFSSMTSNSLFFFCSSDNFLLSTNSFPLISRMFHRSLESLVVSGSRLEKIITVFGVLKYILSLLYFDAVACPSLIFSRIRYKLSSAATQRASLNRKISRELSDCFYKTLHKFSCLIRKSNLTTLLKP